MAGDWIPIQTDLSRRREVLSISKESGRPRHEVVGLLVEFWGWATGETDVDAIVDVYVDMLPSLVGGDPEFWSAVIRAGWLAETKTGLRVPNFDRWMSAGAKSRLRKNLRQKNWRNKQSENGKNVDASVDTQTSLQNRTEQYRREENRTEQYRREEKRREEKKNPSVELVNSTVGLADVESVITHYQQYHPRSKPGDKEKSKIHARLKDGYSVDDLKAAIDGCHRSPFNCGENSRGTKYQSLELIVRDASHVNQFLEVPLHGAEPVLSERTRRNMRAAAAFLKSEESKYVR